jgi:hypothetical protein
MNRDDLPSKTTIARQEAKAPPTLFFTRQTSPAHAKGAKETRISQRSMLLG